MKVRYPVYVFLSTVLAISLLAACGGGGSGDGDEQARSLSEVMLDLEAYYLDLDGDEIVSAPLIVSSGSVDINIELLGVALCEPSDGLAPPDVANISTPNISLYGCTNSLFMAWQLDDPVTPTAVQMTLTIPILYTDDQGTYQIFPLSQQSYDGFTLTDSIEAAYDLPLTDNGDGTYSFAATVLPTDLTDAGTTIETDSPLDAYANLMLPTVQDYLDDIFNLTFASITEDFLATVGKVTNP